jgi:hypothetical protein
MGDIEDPPQPQSEQDPAVPADHHENQRISDDGSLRCQGIAGCGR